jgi:hypothetical protein
VIKLKKLIWFGILASLVCLVGCGGTYHSIEVSYSPVPKEHSQLALEIISPEKADKKEIENFRELIISALRKRGIGVVNDVNKPVLTVKIVEFRKDILDKNARDFLGPPFGYKTTNLINIHLFLKDKAETIEFPEFKEFKESIRDWGDMKVALANRIADAVYFAAR